MWAKGSCCSPGVCRAREDLKLSWQTGSSLISEAQGALAECHCCLPNPRLIQAMLQGDLNHLLASLSGPLPAGKRKVLQKIHCDRVWAVTVSTPDHTLGPAGCTLADPCPLLTEILGSSCPELRKPKYVETSVTGASITEPMCVSSDPQGVPGLPAASMCK